MTNPPLLMLLSRHPYAEQSGRAVMRARPCAPVTRCARPAQSHLSVAERGGCAVALDRHAAPRGAATAGLGLSLTQPYGGASRCGCGRAPALLVLCPLAQKMERAAQPLISLSRSLFRIRLSTRPGTKAGPPLPAPPAARRPRPQPAARAVATQLSTRRRGPRLRPRADPQEESHAQPQWSQP